LGKPTKILDWCLVLVEEKTWRDEDGNLGIDRGEPGVFSLGTL